MFNPLKSVRSLITRRRGRDRTVPVKSARTVLVVAADPLLTDRLDRLLRAEQLEPVPVTSPSYALELLSRSEHLLVVVETPLTDLTLGEFVNELRARTGSRQGGLLVLTETEVRSQVQREIGGSGTVLVRHAPDELLRTVLARLASSAPRKRPGAVVTARLVPEVSSSPLVCPVVNLSSTGALVVTQRLLPVGTRCQIELTVEGNGGSCSTTGWIVRHQHPSGPADPLYDRMAIRFLQGGATAEDRLLRFLESV